MRYVFILFILFNLKAQAFDLWPEYQSVYDTYSISKARGLVHSEYGSDYLTFSLPASSSPEFEKSNERYELSLGSISGKEFLIQQKLKLDKKLNEKIDFSFKWWDQGDYDQESSQFLWGLRHQLQKDWHFGLIGSAYHKKSRNDVGAEITHVTDNKNKIQFIIFRPDFQKNKRTRETAKWQTAPTIYTLKLTRLTDKLYREFFLKFEPEYHETFTDSTNFNKAQRASAGAQLTNLNYALQLQADTKTESTNSTSGKDRYQLLQSRFEKKSSYNNRPVLFGLGYFQRHFESATTSSKEMHDIIPYAWVNLSSWDIGFDVSQNVNTSNKDRLNGRLNTKWSHEFSNESKLAFYFTFDADRLGSSETWEGGGAHFFAHF